MRLKTAWHELYQWTKQKATGCCVVVVILAECNYISFNILLNLVIFVLQLCFWFLLMFLTVISVYYWL